MNFSLDMLEQSSKTNANNNGENHSAEKPLTHKACRSLDEYNLTPYQNKNENLKSGIVYVDLFFLHIIHF